MSHVVLPESLALGGLSLQSPFLLAPLEGVSDAGFRRLCFEQGAGLTFTEMIRARGLAKRNKSTIELVDTFHKDVPTGVQLMTTSANELLDALGVLNELAQTTHPHIAHVVAVDLNFGCPSKDIVQIGAGPAMLKRRAKITSILEALKQAKAEGIISSIYTHPLGFHGHAAGPAIGMWDMQQGVPGTGDFPLNPHTAYSIELNAATDIPEWKKQVRIMLEEDGYWDGSRFRYINGRQTEIYRIPRK
jgi:hypothetical protein